MGEEAQMSEYIVDERGEVIGEVVRCLDCAFMGHDKIGTFCTRFECWLCGEPSSIDMEPESFCSWGERRDA